MNFAALIDQGQLAKAAAILEKVRITGGVMEPVEFTVRCKDGHYIEIETNGSVITHEGKPQSCLGIARDVTESKRATRELREGEERYRTTFENVSDVVFAYDTELRVLYVSPSVERSAGIQT